MFSYDCVYIYTCSCLNGHSQHNIFHSEKEILNMVHRTSLIVVAFVLLVLIPRSYSSQNVRQGSSPKSEYDLVEFCANLIHSACEFFLIGTTGRGLDYFAPELVQGGPPPVGVRMANLDPLTKNVSYQFGLVNVGHLRFSLIN